MNKDTRSIFPMKQNSSKFTLIELLVVISIVALLIAILLPALASARDAARAIECSVRLKNLGVLSITYVQDNKDYLQTQIGNPEGADEPNKKKYDPRVWLRAGEQTFVERLKKAFEDLNNVNTL